MKKQQKKIRSLQRAIDIIDLFNGQRREMGVTEIARALEMPKSTVAGLIFTLEQNHYLSQHPETRKYSLGYKLVERAGVLLDQMDLRRIAEPILQILRDTANESVNLAIRDGNYVTYIARMQGDNVLRMRSEIGKREMIHSTALGKAILADHGDDELADIVRAIDLIPVTPRTITSADEFLRELNLTRERGFAIDDEENETGGRCVAAAIQDYLGGPIAAISLSVPIQRFPDEKINEYGGLVKQAADTISKKMGAKRQEDAGEE
jgi:DNA-binding IclR family transcriptional regulator